jgi:peptidoglycan/xylan/chitin deacetylase (PgdA/CDA1 family)
VNRRIAVLAYHKIGTPPEGGWDTCNFLPVELFARHLELLHELAWEVVDADTFVSGLTAPARLPHRAALLTFDDAHISVLRDALPLLRRHGFPAVCFVPTAFVGGTNSFDLGIEPIEPVCTWDELAELERHGVSAQSHSRSHPWLSLLSAGDRERELVESRRAIEERLDRAVTLFAYPYSDACLSAGGIDAEVAAAGYRAAFLCGGEAINSIPIRAPYRVARLEMHRETDLRAQLAAVADPTEDSAV